MYCLYCIENYINGKIYIGQAKILRRRINHHIRDLNNNEHYNKHLQNSWNKYGERSFIFTKLTDSIYNKEDINELEKYYIKLTKCYDMNFGYNLTYGGEGISYNNEMRLAVSKRMKGVPKTEQQKLRMSKSAMGRNLGGKWTEHQRLAITNALYNQTQSEATKKKRALRQTGKGNHRHGKPAFNCTAIYAYDFRGVFIGEFHSQKAAAIYLNVSKSNISNVVRGIKKYHKGYTFKYAKKEV